MIRMGGGPGADPEAEKKTANQVRSLNLFFLPFPPLNVIDKLFDKL